MLFTVYLNVQEFHLLIQQISFEEIFLEKFFFFGLKRVRELYAHNSNVLPGFRPISHERGAEMGSDNEAHILPAHWKISLVLLLSLHP